MPGIADRVERVAPSGTVRISDAIARLKKQGREVVSFGAGEPDFATPTPVVEAAKKALDDGHTHYISAWGLPELRERIAEKSRRDNGIPAEAENVLVTPAKQAVSYCLLGLVNDGDEVILPDPAWVSYEPLVRLAGGRPVWVPTSGDDGWQLHPDDVAEAVTDRTKMIILNSPSNPTGAVQPPATIRAVADACRDHDLWLVSDELYEKVLYEGEHLSPASLPGMFERTLTVNGFSKAYAMTGWRLGWLVGETPVMRQLVKLQQHSLTHSASFGQYGAIAALTMDQAPVVEMVEAFQRRRALILEKVRAIDGFDLPVDPQGAFYVFPRYTWDMPSLAFAEFLLEEAGVAVTPGGAFGQCGEGHVRISYATSESNIEKGLDRVAEAVQKL